MFSIGKWCATVAVVSFAMTPIAATYGQDANASGTEKFNAAPGGEPKVRPTTATIPGNISASRIPGNVIANHRLIRSTDTSAPLNRSESASAPVRSRGDQSAPSEMGQK